MINEGHVKSEVDIRELMSGNICRCEAYPHIVEAIQSVINTHQPLTLQDQARAGRPSSLESDQKSVVEWVKTGTHRTRDIAERIEEK